VDGLEVMDKDIKYTDKDLLFAANTYLHLMNFSIDSLEKRLKFLKSEKAKVEQVISMLDQIVKRQASASTNNVKSNPTITILDELKDNEND